MTTYIPNFVYQHPPRKEISSELHHNYIIFSELGFVTGRVIKCQFVVNHKHSCMEYIYRLYTCLLYTSPSPRDATLSRMPSSA